MLPSGKLRPASPQVDLSHLSQDEREVIQSVIERQKALESETFLIERYVNIYFIMSFTLLLFHLIALAKEKARFDRVILLWISF